MRRIEYSFGRASQSWHYFLFIIFCRCKAGQLPFNAPQGKRGSAFISADEPVKQTEAQLLKCIRIQVKAMDAPYRRRRTCFLCRPRDVHSAAICSVKIVISVMDARCMTNPSAKKLQIASKARPPLPLRKILFFRFIRLAIWKQLAHKSADLVGETRSATWICRGHRVNWKEAKLGRKSTDVWQTRISHQNVVQFFNCSVSLDSPSKIIRLLLFEEKTFLKRFSYCK